MPPPTGISPALPSTTPRAAGSFFGVPPFCVVPAGAGEEAGGPIARADGAGPPCGGTPASLASYGTAAVLQPASAPPRPARPTAPSSTRRLVRRGPGWGSPFRDLAVPLSGLISGIDRP